MPNTVATTPALGWPLPVNNDDPDVPGDLYALATRIEKTVVGIYASATARDTATASIVTPGMFAFTLAEAKLWYRGTSAWIEFVPRDPVLNPAIRSGTAAPVNTTGVDGDVYIQY